MNVRLFVLGCFFPESLKRRALQELFYAAGAAFDADVLEARDIALNIPSRRLLANFARFTTSQCEKVIHGAGDIEQIQARLFRNAKRLGTGLRRLLKLQSPRDVMQAGRILYKLIGTDFRGREDGVITINRCFFSNYYSSRACTIMSAMDAGITAGLSGGGALYFTQRITEGHNRCKAQLKDGAAYCE
jgi:hypothetical protein